MTQAELKDLLNNVVTDISIAADYAGILDPQLVPFIAIGKAVGKVVPGLVAAVDGMIQGNPLTQAELDEKAAELAVLGDKSGI